MMVHELPAPPELGTRTANILAAGACLALPPRHDPIDPREAVTRCRDCHAPLIARCVSDVPILHRLAVSLVDRGAL